MQCLNVKGHENSKCQKIRASYRSISGDQKDGIELWVVANDNENYYPTIASVYNMTDGKTTALYSSAVKPTSFRWWDIRRP